MEIDPHDKAMIDNLVEAEGRAKSRSGWTTALIVLGISLVLLYLFNSGLVSGWVGITLAIAGVFGVFVFLVFLSTKPYGHSDTSSRWWWLRWFSWW